MKSSPVVPANSKHRVGANNSTMLTKELLEVTKRKPNIHPNYRDIDEYRQVAKQVIEVYEPGKTRGEIEDEIAGLETHDTFKFVRGMSKLLDRRSTFEMQAPISPANLRAAVFDRGFVTDEDERDEVVSQVANEFDLTSAEIEEGLWADRDENETLVSTPDIDPDELLKQYNLSLTQTLLFDAVELEFTASGNYQEIFGLLKYLGLMYYVDEDLSVTVTGPASLFKKTRKYGTTLAKLLPSIMKAEDWSISAQIETEVSDETRIYEFSVDDSQEALFPKRTTVESFDSEVERDFATRIDSLAEGWTVKREPTILRAGNRVMIPDFSFERDYGEKQNADDDQAAFYLEVVGFWTPEYLEEKLAKVREVEAEKPVILAVNQELNCTAADFEETNVDQVFFYEDTIPVKPVLSRLNAIKEDQVEKDRQKLERDPIEVPTDSVTNIDKLARQQQVEPDAIRRWLKDNDEYQGVISNDKYVPKAILTTIREEIEALDSPMLDDVSPILAQYGVAQNILEEIGFTIQYTSLDQEELAVRKDD
ncbi:MAG: DUF790 family protein [Halobacteriaceae archaeon]